MPERPVTDPGARGAGAAPAVILGVAASDAHVVANRLIDLALTQAGYEVINLGPCTPVADFVACFAAHPHALAVAIGSLNGHAVTDLAQLREAKDHGLLRCPVIVGGNLSVAEAGRGAAAATLAELGVDYVLDDIADLVALLGRLGAERSVPAAPEPALLPVA